MVSEEKNITLAEAKTSVIRTDRRRANYYNYYTGKKWGRLENYDLAISSSVLGIDKTAEVIADIYRKWDPEARTK